MYDINNFKKKYLTTNLRFSTPFFKRNSYILYFRLKCSLILANMNLNYVSSVFMEFIMRISHCMQVLQGRIQLAKKEDRAHFERESRVRERERQTERQTDRGGEK